MNSIFGAGGHLETHEFTGQFESGAKVEVDGNAFLRLMNAFLSGQTHRVLEIQAIMRLPNSDIEVLVNDVRKYINGSNSEPAKKQVIVPISNQVITLREPEEDELAALIAATKSKEPQAINDFVGALKNSVEQVKSFEEQTPKIYITNNYPKLVASGYKEGEVVSRIDGERFFMGQEDFTDTATLVKSIPEKNLLFLGTFIGVGLGHPFIWTAPLDIINDVEPTGVRAMDHTLVILKQEAEKRLEEMNG